VSYLLKVANKAPSLFKGSEPTVKRQILKLLLQNCQVKGVTLYPTYRSPFDMFAEGASRTKWLPLLDVLRTFCCSPEARIGAEKGLELLAA
jgi:hypothetical protein